MKGKKILTLLSICAGAAVVGTTVAAWAVTDNADPFGIKVSPGHIQSDETQYVTLSYGQRSFANVEGLEAGVPQVAGSVVLMAETKDGTTFKDGVFSIEIKHESPAASEQLLKKSLGVDIYEGEVEIKKTVVETVTTYSVVKKGTTEAAVSLGHIPPEAGVYKLDKALEVPSTGKQISVVVSLDANTDAKDLAEMANDVVYLAMDWNVSSTLDIITGHTVYLLHNATYDMYCYAWSATGTNGDFPGVKMADLGMGQFSYELSTDYDKLLFVERNGDNSVWQTADITVSSNISATKDCVFRPDAGPQTEGPNAGKYEGDWEDKSTETLTKPYYVTSSSKGNWKPSEAYGMTLMADESNMKYESGVLSFAAGEAFKVCSQNKMEWYSSAEPWDGCGFTLDGDGNVSVTTAGNYKVVLDLTASKKNYVSLVKQS